ncbi:MAG: DinB family protein [Gemmatimonadaceae bacterium]
MAQASGPVWLQGPISGVPDHLQPVAHALVEAGNDVRALLADLTTEETWTRPHGAASVGFHVRHSQGSLDRLLTYARGHSLSEAQLAVLAAEKTMDGSVGGPGQLATDHDAAIDRALGQLRSTSPDTLLERREVGRARLPSTVLGLLAHAGDHTYRHVGQAITTAKIVKGMRRD